ncbi:MAG: metallophosphoesterase family protein [Candidatus Woesearchaeota archaeon]
MKVLFFVDTHGSRGCLRRLREKSTDVDLLVCAGDFTIFEGGMTSILKDFNDIGKPMLLIHGNHETSSSVLVECAQLKNLHFIHKKYFVYDDLVFYGFGGGGFSITDEQFTHESELFMREFKRLSDTKKYRLILVTHAPPYGTRLDYLGEHVGNKNIVDFIHKYHPMLAVSGHLHENAGIVDKINITRMINPGADGVILDL